MKKCQAFSKREKNFLINFENNFDEFPREACRRISVPQARAQIISARSANNF